MGIQTQLSYYNKQNRIPFNLIVSQINMEFLINILKTLLSILLYKILLLLEYNFKIILDIVPIIIGLKLLIDF